VTAADPPARLMVVVAHPDDETFGCGSLLLHAAARGVETAVVCATRGEAGEPAPGSGIEQADLARVREEELYDAARILRVSRVDVLDFRDSGMAGEPEPGTLVAAPMEEVRDVVRTLLEDFRPTIVVALEGTDGHRDHLKMRDATLAAVEAARAPVQRVYLYSLPRSRLNRWIDHLRRANPSMEHLDLGIPGTPDEDVTTLIPTPEHLEARERAIAAHHSQLSPYEGLPPDLRREFLTSEPLRRVVPAWEEGGPIETALFA
jgi:LmbE family N-acetylglucosaminyl deacetylase